jgi:peptidyl-dipeptidase A
LAYFEDLYNYVVSNPTTLNRLDNGRQAHFNELDQRRYDLIYSDIMVGRVESTPTISRLRDSLSNIDIQFRATYDGQRRPASYLYNLYRRDADRNRRESAFRAYNEVGDSLADGLQRLIRLRNQTASRLGYTNYFTLAYRSQNLDPQDYLKLLRDLDSLSAEPYRQLLEKRRTALNVSQLEIWDLAFSDAALMRQVDSHFPVDSQMNYIQRSLFAIGFDLDSLPIYFDLESREGKSQFAYEFGIRPPYDQRVLANLANGIYSIEVLLHELGHALEDAAFAQDRQLFAWSQSGAWTEGMAQTVASLVSDSTWLVDYAHFNPNLASRYLESRREQDVIYLRSQLVRLLFEFEAYNNPNRDLNQLYWDLFERYMYLPRHENVKPWAAVIHYTTHPVYLQNYLYADMIASQTLAYVREQYGEPVDNTAFHSFLNQNYFRFGSRYPWQELLERGTGQELSPDAYEERLGL